MFRKAPPPKLWDRCNADLDRSERERKANLAALHHRLEPIRTRIDQIYEDKLNAVIQIRRP
jgi:hypothetical protein